MAPTHPWARQRRIIGVITSSHGAELIRSPAKTAMAPKTAVLVLHGGSADSFARTRWRDPAVVRLWPVATVIGRQLPEVAVYRLRLSVRGWNGGGDAALRDARWALDSIRDLDPGVPIVLVGHSLGGRVALRLGGDQEVAGVVGLAPWIPSDDPVAQLAGVPVVVVQAGRDRVIPEGTGRPWLAHAENAGALLTRTVLPWAGHTMIRRFWVWHRLAAQGVRTVLTASAGVSRPVDRTAPPPSP